MPYLPAVSGWVKPKPTNGLFASTEKFGITPGGMLLGSPMLKSALDLKSNGKSKLR